MKIRLIHSTQLPPMTAKNPTKSATVVAVATTLFSYCSSITLTMTPKGLSSSLIIAIVSFLILLRTLIGLHHHSGQDNYHGAKEHAYGGDYEAQRHWMELTLHLPMGEWYWYDLEYWGLDYPPLTAYISYVCGVGSSWLVGPETVALFESRGYEDSTHKAYMRATVWILDVLLYFPTGWLLAKRMFPDDTSKFLWTFILALSQPALLLIDHGHFQYNSVSLAFALLACYYVTQHSFFPGCVIGSIYFCLALNFKQMTLYYAPAIFFYLLGRCFVEPKQSTQRFVVLGVTVVSTFSILWWPFVLYGPPNTTPTERLVHVLERIFPFQRGLFEGKVSNLWCALDVKPFAIRQRLSPDIQPLVALSATLLLILPTCYKLFNMGRLGRGTIDDQKRLLWGMASTGLAFFLASFQVHEKSILLALAPISLLYWNDTIFVQWFSVVGAWTLWPLLQVDRLESAYVCILAIFVCQCWLSMEGHDRRNESSFFKLNKWTRMLVPLSYIGMATLHVLQMLVEPPPALPDLFPVLWSIAGAGMFCLAWLATCWHLYQPDTATSGSSKVKLL